MAKTQISIPAQAPVMVLPNTLLFPHSVLPLFIFEPRYRAMLQHALEHDRMFCVALRKPERDETQSGDHFFHIAGLGMIRACVGRADGTSHLMLQGMVRVRFRHFTQESPFFIANVEPLPSTDSDAPSVAPLQAAQLAEEVRNLCGRFKEQGIEVPEAVVKFLRDVDDPDLLADTVAHTFLRDPLRRQALLEEPRVVPRLSLLTEHLRSELGA